MDKVTVAEWKLSGKCHHCGEAMISSNGITWDKNTQQGNLICRYYYCPSKIPYPYGYEKKENVGDVDG